MAGENLRPTLVHNVPCDIRPGRPGDIPFIKDSWLKCLKRSPTHKHIPQDFYNRNQEIITTQLISGAKTVVLVACNPSDHDQILGYIVGAQSMSGVVVCHWVHVKRIYRLKGIGGALKAALTRTVDGERSLPLVFTHISENYSWLSKHWNVVFNPYLITVELEYYDPKTSYP